MSPTGRHWAMALAGWAGSTTAWASQNPPQDTAGQNIAAPHSDEQQDAEARHSEAGPDDTTPCLTCAIGAISAGSAIDWSASLGVETAANVSGGLRHRVANASQLVASATLDAERVLGLRGGIFKATITYRQGKELGATAGLGTLQQVQEVYGRGQTWRLTQFWYSQPFGRADIKLGRLTQGEDFGNFSCAFMNLTFCGMPAGNIAGDYWFNWPISQWGIRLRVSSNGVSVMTGIYENNPRNLEKTFTIGHFHGATGVLIPIEFALARGAGPTALPGTYKVGAWYNSSNADDVGLFQGAPVIGVQASSLRRSGRYGVYLQFQQQLTGTASESAEGRVTDRGLVAFLNVTQADRRTSRTDNQLALGLAYTGLLDARPKDTLGLAVGRTNVNGRAVARKPGVKSKSLGAEYVAELDYGVHINDWLTLRPNIQYVLDPGGDRRANDVVVLGLKGAISI